MTRPRRSPDGPMRTTVAPEFASGVVANTREISPSGSDAGADAGADPRRGGGVEPRGLA